MKTETSAQVIKEYWGRALSDLGISATATANATIEAVISRYREPHRHWHTEHHVRQMLEQLDAWHPPLAPDAVFSAIYHDAVYVPGASDNEQRSAYLAQCDLVALGIGQAGAEHVVELILGTRQHSLGLGFQSALVNDADMAILGSAPARYREYAAAVREEHAMIPSRRYCLGRGWFLTRLLMRPAIYATRFGQPLERPARANIRWELLAMTLDDQAFHGREVCR